MQVYKAGRKPAVDRLCLGIPRGEVRETHTKRSTHHIIVQQKQTCTVWLINTVPISTKVRGNFGQYPSDYFITSAAETIATKAATGAAVLKILLLLLLLGFICSYNHNYYCYYYSSLCCCYCRVKYVLYYT